MENINNDEVSSFDFHYLQKVMALSFIIVSGFMFINEVYGINMQYGRFSLVKSKESSSSSTAAAKESGNSELTMFGSMSSRAGMLVIYTPALLFAIIFPLFINFIITLANKDVSTYKVSDGFYNVRLLLIAHFVKRDLEVLFIHKYSGRIGMLTISSISTNYLGSTIVILSELLLFSNNEAEVTSFQDFLNKAGYALFLIGEFGNFYYHCLLANLRAGDGEKSKVYSIPRGGLFDYVTCPHYFFELIAWYGISMVSDNLIAYSIALSMTGYLCGRSVATAHWYRSKFEDYPKSLKFIFPFIF